MKKSKINFIIDFLMFAFMFAIAGIGLLIKFILIPGKERWIKYGSNVDLFLFGMDRHEWGTIHLILGFILLGLLALHIILHWKMILSMYCKLIEGKKIRKMIALIFIIICAIFIIYPFTANIEIQKHKREDHHITKQADSHKTHHHHTTNTNIEVEGYMTLNEVAEKYNVPVKHLKKHLGISLSTPDEEKLGRLKKRYGFSMGDVRKIIDEYKIIQK